MKIIKRGYEKEVTCPQCKDLLLYDSNDMHFFTDMESDTYLCVTCPDCGNEIKVM